MTEPSGTSAPPSASDSGEPDYSSLSWLLVIIALANLTGVGHGLMSRDEILEGSPHLTSGLLAAAMGAAVVNVISIVGLLQWRRWGAIGLTLGLTTLLVINVWVDAPMEFTLLMPVAMLLVGMYLWPLRDKLG